MNAPGKTCARAECTDTEFRIDGYCSIYCRDVDELEDEKDAEIAALKASHTLAEAGEGAAQREVVALNAEIAGLRNVIDQLDAQVKVEGGGYKALAAEIAGLKEDLHAFAAERDEARANLADADEALAACQDDLGGQIQEHASLSESHAELSDRVVTLTAKIERLVEAGDNLLSHLDCSEIETEPHESATNAWTTAKESP